MPKNIKKRLVEQLKAKGMSESKAHAVAHSQMRKSGNITKSGKLTAKGKKRSAMGAAGRAKDRAAKTSGKKPSQYKYNPRTNRATLKKKK